MRPLVHKLQKGRYFTDLSHGSCNIDEGKFLERLNLLEKIILDRVSPQTYDDFEAIDNLIVSEPLPENIDVIVGLLRKRVANVNYFFSRLDSPLWLKPLDEHGLLSSPPKAMRDKDGKVVGTDWWPPIEYLQNITGQEPEAVLKILLREGNTDDYRVIYQFTDIACKMPPRLAAKWAMHLSRWIANDENDSFESLDNISGALISQLANGGAAESGLSLARVILCLKDGGHDPVPKYCDAWGYRQILEKNLPDVGKELPTLTIQLLYGLLNDVIGIVRSKYQGAAEGYDFSPHWRKAIEEHKQNLDLRHDVKGPIIVALRKLLEKHLAATPDGIAEIVRSLESQKWLIFQRIALHLLRLHPNYELVSARLLDKKNLNNPGLRHEYMQLLSARFKHLSFEDQRNMLALIDEGPDSKKDSEAQINYWKMSKISLVATDLPDDWKKRLAAWIEEFGAPEHPDFSCYSTDGWVSPGSPFSLDDLQDLPIAVVIDKIASWRPLPAQRRISEPSIYGLSRVLLQIIESKLDEFTKQLPLFMEKISEPTYVRTIFEVYRDALKKGASIDWAAVLTFAEWAINPNRPVPAIDTAMDDSDRDPDWTGVQHAMLDMINAATDDDKTTGYPEDKVWAIVASLAKTATEPTPESDREMREREDLFYDPYTRAISVTRGIALGVAFSLACRQWNTLSPEMKNIDGMSNLKDLIEDRLQNDPSPAVRSVFGINLQNLYAFDSKWASVNLQKIFSCSGKAFDPSGDAAWRTYISYHDPLHGHFDELACYYSMSLSDAKTFAPDSNAQSFAGRLGMHLFVLYGRGVISLNSADSLIKQFFTNASDSLRATTLKEIASSLHDLEGAQDASDIIGRFKELWQWRRAVVASTDEDKALHIQEALAFPSWMESGAFDDKWCLDQLASVLTYMNGNLEKHDRQEYVIAEQLRQILNDSPSLAPDVMACIALMVRIEAKPWFLAGCENDMMQIFEKLLACSTTRDDAKQAVNDLLAKGYPDYKVLLDSKS